MSFFISSCSMQQNSLALKKEAGDRFFITEEVKLAPGEVKLLKLPRDVREVFCGNESFSIQEINNEMYVFLTEDYFTSFRERKCQILGANNFNLGLIKIYPEKKSFPKDQLTVAPKRVHLSKKNLRRAIKEKKMMSKIYAKKRSEVYIKEPFVVPLKSFVTSVYGTQRVFNGTKKGQHLGIDLRAAVGVPIPASNRGLVVFTGHLFYTGNTVVLYHGPGVFTSYSHLNKILVKEGDLVDKLQIVGEAGMTGRVTGPHLHWGVYINGSHVDGMSLVETTTIVSELEF